MASKSLDQIINDIGTLTALELSELSKGLKEKFNLPDMPMGMAFAGAAAPAAEAKKEEAKTEYKVELVDGGANKIGTIKALRTVTTLGLTEAKKAVEETPSVIGEAVAKADAEKMKEVLEAAGAKVKLS